MLINKKIKALYIIFLLIGIVFGCSNNSISISEIDTTSTYQDSDKYEYKESTNVDVFNNDYELSSSQTQVTPLVDKHLVMGDAEISVEQAETYLHSINPEAPYYAYLYEIQGKKENVRWDIAFAQSLVETGYFKFGGDVLPEQNNFAGIGTTGNGVRGNYFPSPEIGILAQIQHLKAYASKESLNEVCVDQRFKYVNRGIAPYIEDFGSGIWAADRTGYGKRIYNIIETIKNV